jgi:hypothetical protein
MTSTLVERLRSPKQWSCIFPHEGATRVGTTDAPFQAADMLDECERVLLEALSNYGSDDCGCPTCAAIRKTLAKLRSSQSQGGGQ